MKHFFSPSEDALLSDVMQSEHFLSWDEVSERIPGRSPKQCRDRWLNYLAPWIKKGRWTKEEDELIIKSVRKIGTKWSKLATLLPGRTDNDVKNRWYTHLSKRIDRNFKNGLNPLSKRAEKDETQKQTRQENIKQTIDFWTEIDSANSPFEEMNFANIEMFF
jgi:hypothetical protein